MAPKSKRGAVAQAKRLARPQARVELGPRSFRASGVIPDEEWLRISLHKVIQQKFGDWPEVLATGV
eukprot:11194816-Lingulodinium_polyedra.AAC.1